MPVLQSTGNTYLINIEGIYVKLECSNPGGSVKDRIAEFMVREASRRGELKPGDTIVEATSGNTGIALAGVGRQLGYRVLIFMPEQMTIERRQMIESLGAEVRLTSRERSFEGAIEKRDSFRGRPGYYVPDQFGNPDNTLCHRLTTGAEIVAQLRENGPARADCFVAGVGTGGTLMGVGQALREANPDLNLVAVEPSESPVMAGGEAGDHGISGIGDGFIPDLIDMKQIDEVIHISTMEAHAEAERIRSKHGFCVGPSAGANTLAALRLQAMGQGTVVTVWPDCANRYISVGLEPPSSAEVRCTHREDCHARTMALLGDPDGTRE